MMTHFITIYKFISFCFCECTREGESKIALTFSYYFRVDVLNNFIRNRVTVKSNDFKSLFGNEKHSKP